MRESLFLISLSAETENITGLQEHVFLDRQLTYVDTLYTFSTIWPWLKGIYILMWLKLNMSTLMHFSRRITTFTIISMENLCAHAVIDTFITSKGFNFLFNHTTVWIAFPIEFNNKAHYHSLKDGVLLLAHMKVCQTIYNKSHNSSGLTAPLYRFLSNTFVSADFYY